MRIKELDLDLQELEKSRELRAKRRVLSQTLEGSWSAMLKGRGMEFAGFRQYTPSDDASRIDWGASLRANDILVREFEEFKSVNVMFLVDVSDTMLLTSQKKLKVEYGVELAFHMAVALLNNGDSVGYAMFNDELIVDELPNMGRVVINRMARSFMDPKNYGGKKNFGKVITQLNARLKERALIVIVSDFLGFEEGWDRYVKMAGQKFDLIGIMIRDPMDAMFPDESGQMLLSDMFSDERMLVDVGDVKKIYEAQAAKEELRVKRIFDTSKSGLVIVDTSSEDMLRPIIKYFKKRAAVVRG